MVLGGPFILVLRSDAIGEVVGGEQLLETNLWVETEVQNDKCGSLPICPAPSQCMRPAAYLEPSQCIHPSWNMQIDLLSEKFKVFV
ncbi:unnamed protein product [Bursaphelenchus okinawaensis]|uniref:Uncharacterized protein n=1 Tax=Bursaphelenchus okinawaensis TaxID=465554 RepID=A0A811K3Z2_9BILA|nr:unnamed protein product [Bursaphelenchus okinawaensis]CAG9090178.1 unnamed protein product [Bursaphelenchus okinawaensis]